MIEMNRRDTGEVLQAIHRVLTPYVGKLMASTAASAHCRDLGIAGEAMDETQLDVLLQRLHLGLVIFLGQERSALVVAAMRREISTLHEVTH